MLERFHLKRLFTIGDLDAHRAARGKGDHLVGGKPPLGENFEHFAAHIARGANDRDLVTHRSLSGRKLPGSAVRRHRTEALLCENASKDNRSGPLLASARTHADRRNPRHRRPPARLYMRDCGTCRIGGRTFSDRAGGRRHRACRSSRLDHDRAARPRLRSASAGIGGGSPLRHPAACPRRRAQGHHHLRRARPLPALCDAGNLPPGNGARAFRDPASEIALRARPARPGRRGAGVAPDRNEIRKHVHRRFRGRPLRRRQLRRLRARLQPAAPADRAASPATWIRLSTAPRSAACSTG